MDFNSYVYSVKAAKRLFENAKGVQVRDRDVLVIFEDGQTESHPQALFKKHFAEYRKQLGQQLQNAWQNSETQWSVGIYQVQVELDRLICNCQDYKNQQAVGIKRATCKHAYAVLFQLGCNSLSEFIHQKTRVTTDPQKEGTLPSCCRECPLSKHIDGDLDRGRYLCGGSILSDLVVRGHHKPSLLCQKAIQSYYRKARSPF